MLNLRMPGQKPPKYLLASADLALLAAAEPVLIAEGVVVEIASSADAVLECNEQVSLRSQRPTGRSCRDRIAEVEKQVGAVDLGVRTAERQIRRGE